MNMQYDLKAFAKKVKKHQEKERYEHTKGVMYTAAALAMAYGCDLEKARVAGLCKVYTGRKKNKTLREK